MIVSFKDKQTAAVADGTVRKGFPFEMVRRAQQLLAVMEAAISIEDLRSRLETVLRSFLATGKGNTLCGSTSNGGFVLYGRSRGREMSKLWTITEE